MSADSILLILVYIVIFVLLFLVVRSASKNDRDYDEMQLQIRSKAYKIALMVIICMLAVAGLLYITIPDAITRFISFDMTIFIILYAALIVFTIFSIVKGAFFSIDKKAKSYALICAIIVVVNTTVFISYIADGTFAENGTLTFTNGGSSILNAVTFGTALIAMLFKALHDKKEIVE